MLNEIKQTPWLEDEEAAFTVVVGQWVRAWFSELGRSGNSVTLGPKTESHLALFWRAGREYERLHGGSHD